MEDLEAAKAMKDLEAAFKTAEIIRRAENAEAERDRLREVLASVPKIAGEAFDHWDNDRDAKVGKFLVALAGYTKGYRADIDAIHEAIKEAR